LGSVTSNAARLTVNNSGGGDPPPDPPVDPPGEGASNKIKNPFRPLQDSYVEIPCNKDIRILNQAKVEVEQLICSGTAVRWDGKDASSGNYLIVEEGKETRKVVVLK